MLMQVFYIENQNIAQAKDIPQEKLNELGLSKIQYETAIELDSIQSKLVKASYILTLIALIEIIIISRLLN